MSTKETDVPTTEDMIQMGIRQIIRAFGKGEDLRGAVGGIVLQSAAWGADNYKRRQEEAKAERKRKTA